MIQTVTKASLPVDEELVIEKMRLMPLRPQDNMKRISVVTGIHGDELEGQYVCYQLSRFIQENIQNLRGIVDIYPALNPLGIDSISRGIPAFDLDMNRIFPGRSDGDMNEHLASGIVADLKGSDLCIDIHASNIFLSEVPQIRINTLHKQALMPLALEANVDFIWVHGASTVLESTLAHSLNVLDTPTLVVEMGVGMRITKTYGDQLLTGILNLMNKMGIYDGSMWEPMTMVQPIVSDGADDVCFLNAPCSGIFIKDMAEGTFVEAGQYIGQIVNPLSGSVLAKVEVPMAGWLFTIRDYPMVSEGSLMGRILKKTAYSEGE
ncbi:MAG: M14 family metallopeptidase [Eubacteriales bacterium]